MSIITVDNRRVDIDMLSNETYRTVLVEGVRVILNNPNPQVFGEGVVADLIQAIRKD